MLDEEIKIRLANTSDCDDIYRWRIDPVANSMFFNKSIPAFEEHRIWFAAALNDVRRRLYIGELNGAKIGVCRFDSTVKNSLAEVSINMNPMARGRGFGKKFLVLSIQHYLIKNKHDLLAKIKPVNVASLNIFESSGFKPVLTDGNLITLIRGYKQLSFKEVQRDDSDALFELLESRVHSISHKKLPTRDEHQAFVQSHPYRYWALILEDSYPIGAFYLQNDNSVGLNISTFSQYIVWSVLGYIRENFIPREEVKSKIPPYFYINVPYPNDQLSMVLNQSGAIPIQISYKF